MGKDGEALAGCVADAEARQARHAISPEEIALSGFRAYRLVPTRVEILEGGPTWPQGPTRHEWCWKPDCRETWQNLQQRVDRFLHWALWNQLVGSTPHGSNLLVVSHCVCQGITQSC